MTSYSCKSWCTSSSPVVCEPFGQCQSPVVDMPGGVASVMFKDGEPTVLVNISDEQPLTLVDIDEVILTLGNLRAQAVSRQETAVAV